MQNWRMLLSHGLEYLELEHTESIQIHPALIHRAQCSLKIKIRKLCNERGKKKGKDHLRFEHLKGADGS